MNERDLSLVICVQSNRQRSQPRSHVGLSTILLHLAEIFWRTLRIQI